MSFNALFYTFSKKQNSTAQPSGSGTILTVELKDNSSVVEPILRLHNTANWNPSDLNYCYINKFSRYYWVVDWEYALGEWNCYLKSDVLASFKSGIGNLAKYVVRSANESDPNCVDDFYPAVADARTQYEQTKDFLFSRDFDGGVYILGVAANDSDGAGAITYYVLTSTQIRSLVNVMLTPTSGWNNSFTGMTDVLYRAIYQPFDYIKSCKWFPQGIFPLVSQNIKFGNYDSGISGQILNNDVTTWYTENKNYDLPSSWLNLEGKYRVNPNTNIYFWMNPWGVIELNPKDFYDSDTLNAGILFDYISGEGTLILSKVVGSTHYFLTQRTARIGIDINLSSASIDATGLAIGALGTAGVAAGALTGFPAVSVLATAGAATSGFISSLPSASKSIGETTNGARSMTGIGTLIVNIGKFTSENVTEFGNPLYKTRTLSTIPGFIKCADTECDAIGGMYINERNEVGQHLLNGFFYE